MKLSQTIRFILILPAAGLFLSGCSTLKPVVDEVRFFVLAPDLAAASGSPGTPQPAPAVRISRVQVADYLQRRQFAVRQGGHEIAYSANLRWAERLDTGIERVLGVNLGVILGTTNMLTPVWRRDDVAEVQLSVQRFESDAQGRVILEAQWQITKPGAAPTARTGLARIIKQGPAPAANPDEAVATMSQALADLSREIATALWRDSANR